MTSVFLDANVLKFGIVSVTRLVPKNQTLILNGNKISTQVYDMRDVSIQEKTRDNPKLYSEIQLLSEVANLAKQERIKLLTHFETILEHFGLPKTVGRRKSVFEGIAIEEVKNPVEYSRVLLGLGQSPKGAQYNFIKGIKHPRFTELQKIMGAYQGEDRTNRNQLLDAFHFWCAEFNGCDYFLTLDFKLIAYTNSQKAFKSAVRLVSPSELLAAIGGNL